VHSRNLATINLVTDIGLSMMLEELKRFGIKDLPHDLSLSLGSISLSPLALAQYYTSFANNGIQVEPVLVRSVSNSYGSRIDYEEKQRYITSPQQAYLMTTILQDVVKRGTGRNARVQGIEIAGKTGTTNNAMDAWFAGYSPTVETVVWFGNDDNTPMLKRETGGRVAGPAFRHYYEQLIKMYPQTKRHFDKPDGIIETTVKGVKEYFTDISKPPLASPQAQDDEGLIF
jgi:penicillin-binding protein 1A